MWAALGDALPFAVGLALSPFAIVTGIVLLLGVRGLAKTAVFGLGWFAAIALLTALASFLIEASSDAYADATATGVDIGQLVFAAVFFGLAALTWAKRPRPGDDAAGDGGASKESRLLTRLDSLSILGALGAGVLQGLVVIKNIPLAFSAGAVFGEAHLVGASAVAAVLIFSGVATLGVLVPLAVAVAGGRRVSATLARSRVWFEANMSPITLTVLLVLGTLFLGRGLALVD